MTREDAKGILAIGIAGKNIRFRDALQCAAAFGVSRKTVYSTLGHGCRITDNRTGARYYLDYLLEDWDG